ncbi:MAG: site-specific integrase [Desulfobacterales bacterium]|nr:MAG: site-specific integrase [Desulfobacterales bacterium]
MGKLCEVFGDKQLSELTVDTILDFLNQLTDGCKAQTKRIRHGHLAAFFNFIKNNIISDFISPCDSKMLRKLFRPKISFHWDILEKETVDEIIFRTTNARDRLLLELMARGGMRVGEVLKLTPRDVQDRKLIIRDPKSGKEQEVIFIPQKVADRLKEYIRVKQINSGGRIFPICYEAARAIVKKAGEIVDIHLRPHDLRRCAATYASRSGVPLEIVSKLILRHSNLSTTQICLGKVSDIEAIRWIENLYA